MVYSFRRWVSVPFDTSISALLINEDASSSGVISLKKLRLLERITTGGFPSSIVASTTTTSSAESGLKDMAFSQEEKINSPNITKPILLFMTNANLLLLGSQ